VGEGACTLTHHSKKERVEAMEEVKKVDLAKEELIVPKILIGVPILAWTHEFAESFMQFWTELMTYAGKDCRFHVAYKFVYRKPVHVAEEELAQLAVDSGCTHLLLMDDDIYDVHPEDLMRLVVANKDVIGGIMHASGFPHAMCAFRRYDVETKVADQPILKGPCRLYEIPPEQRVGIQPADLIPFCFTLIKTDALRKLPKPWFNGDNKCPTDSWFADKVIDSGLTYFAHFDVWVNHRGVTKANQPHWVQIGLVNSQAKQSQQIIQLTPEEMKRHELFMRVKLEEAEAKMKLKSIEGPTFYDKKEDCIGVVIPKVENNPPVRETVLPSYSVCSPTAKI
jgi:hypothetical protein